MNNGWTEERKLKLIEQNKRVHTGRKRPESTRAKLREAWKTRPPCGEDTRRKRREYWLGSKNPSWNGGCSKLTYPYEFYNNKFLRSRVIFRANGCCEHCGSKNRKKIIHHTDGNIHNNTIDNLTYICYSCHVKYHMRTKIRAFG